jgi:hypothetical protein
LFGFSKEIDEAAEMKKRKAGDIINLAGVQIQPAPNLDRELDKNRPIVLQGRVCWGSATGK